jgi:cell division septum initiation protein DivIVA
MNVTDETGTSNIDTASAAPSETHEDSSRGFTWDELEASIESASAEETDEGTVDPPKDPSAAPAETPPVATTAPAPREGGETVQTPEPGTPEPGVADPFVELRAQNLALQQQLRDLQEQLNKAPAATATATPTAAEAEDYLNGIDFDEAVSTPETFNKVLQAVATKTRDAVLRELTPQLQAAQQLQSQGIKSAVDRFYEANQDLAPFKTAVAALANEVYKEGTGLTSEQILAETAVRARKVLGLKAPTAAPAAPAAPAPKAPSPALNNSPRSGRRQAAPETSLSDVEREIMELM